MGRTGILGELEQMVLMAVLRLQDPYPVSVRDEISAVTGVDLARGTIYVTLHRLEQRGLVESWLGEATPQRGGKPKRCVAVTARGRRALREARAMLDRLGDGIEPLIGE
jgi:PadR family transcriptional regulator, regulatory protein PadR